MSDENIMFSVRRTLRARGGSSIMSISCDITFILSEENYMSNALMVSIVNKRLYHAAEYVSKLKK